MAGIEDTYPAFADNIQRARQAGFSNDEIAGEFQQRIQRATKAGFSPDEISKSLGDIGPQGMEKTAVGGVGDTINAVVEGVKKVPSAALDMAKHVASAAMTQPEEGLFDVSHAPQRMGDFLKGVASGVTAGIYKPQAPTDEAQAARQTAGNLAGFAVPFGATAKVARALGANRLASEVIAGAATGAAEPAARGDVPGAVQAATTGGALGAGFYTAGAAFKKVFGRAPKDQAEIQQAAKQPSFVEEFSKVTPEEVEAFKNESADAFAASPTNTPQRVAVKDMMQQPTYGPDTVRENIKAGQRQLSLQRLQQQMADLNKSIDERSRANRPDYGEQVAAQSAEALTPGTPQTISELLQREQNGARANATAEPAAEVPIVKEASPTVNSGATAKYYRGGPSSEPPRGMTAADVVRYEREELGNNIAVEKGVDLTRYPSESLQWLSPNEEYAAEFGDVSPAELPKGAKILARDPDGGVLVGSENLSRSASVEEKPTPPASPAPVEAKAAVTAARPSLGESGDDVYRGWKEASSDLSPREVVVGIIPGEGVYSFKGDNIVRNFTDKTKRGNVATYRDATKAEIDAIHDAIDNGTFQVERQRITGAGGLFKSTDAGETVKVLHQATGTAPGKKAAPVDTETLLNRARLTDEQKRAYRESASMEAPAPVEAKAVEEEGAGYPKVIRSDEQPQAAARKMSDILKGEKGEVVLREDGPKDETVGKGRLAFGQFLEQSTNTLKKKMGPEGGELADRIKASRNDAEIDAGKAVEAVTAQTKKLTAGEKLNLVDVLEGKAQPVSNAVEAAASVARGELAKVADQSAQVGLSIRNPATGERIPFQPRENYFPHIGGKELGRVVKDPNMRVKIKEQLKAQMGENANDAQVEKALQQILKNARGRYGHLEMARLFDLGDYEKNPNVALSKYFGDAYRRIHLAKQLGPEFEKAEGLLTKIGQSKGQAAEDFGRTLYKRFSGTEEHDPTTRTAVQAATNFQVVTKLGQAVIGNMTQTSYTAITAGLKNTMKGFLKAQTKEGKGFALKSGAILDSAINDFIGESTEAGKSGPLGKAAEIVLKRSGFNFVERMNRAVASNAGKYFADETFAKLQNKPNSAGLRRALEKMNINVDEALNRGSLTPDDQLRAGQAIVNRTQFKTDPSETPLFWSSDAGRLLTQFKKFAFKSSQFLKDEILKEGFKGNLKPLIRAGVVLPVAGAVATKAKDALRFGDQGQSDETIADFVAATGVFGLFTDFIANKGRSSVSGIKYIAGPTVGDIGDFWDVAKQTRNRLVNGEDEPGKPLGKFMARNIPIVGPSIRNIFNDEKTDKQNASAEKRKTMREMGLEKPSKKKLRRELGIE